MARVLLAMDCWPAFGRTALDALARRPELFRALLALHTGHTSLLGFGAEHGCALLCQLLQSARLRQETALLPDAQ